jgi:molybdopterin synthase sulfur carrier subunit
MTVKMRFSSTMLQFTGELERELDVGGETIGNILEQLSKEYGDGFRSRLLQDGEVRRFINVYIDGEDIRYNGGMDASVPDGAEVSILPAISGG